MNIRTKLALTGALAGLALLISGCRTNNADSKSNKILEQNYLAAIVCEGFTNYLAINKKNLEKVYDKIEEKNITNEDIQKAYIFKYGNPHTENSN